MLCDQHQVYKKHSIKYEKNTQYGFYFCKYIFLATDKQQIAGAKKPALIMSLH